MVSKFVRLGSNFCVSVKSVGQRSRPLTVNSLSVTIMCQGFDDLLRLKPFCNENMSSNVGFVAVTSSQIDISLPF